MFAGLKIFLVPGKLKSNQSGKFVFDPNISYATFYTIYWILIFACTNFNKIFYTESIN